MRLGKLQKSILEYCLWLGHVDREYLYKTEYPGILKLIEEQKSFDRKFKSKYQNQIRVSISQSIKALKAKKLITERHGLIFPTVLGRSAIQERNRKELGFTSRKYGKKISIKGSGK